MIADRPPNLSSFHGQVATTIVPCISRLRYQIHSCHTCLTLDEKLGQYEPMQILSDSAANRSSRLHTSQSHPRIQIQYNAAPRRATIHQGGRVSQFAAQPDAL